MSLTKIAFRGKLEVVERKCHGEIEAVIGGFVCDNKNVLFHREVIQVDVVLGGSDQVAELAQFCLPSGLVEELDEIDVGRMRTEVLLESEVNA